MENFAGRLIASARTRSNLSLREIARRAHTSHATLSAYIKGSKSPTTATLARIIEACDMSLDTQLRPRIRRRGSLPRGQELEQVLHLADQFPAHPKRKPGFPIFPGVPHHDRAG